MKFDICALILIRRNRKQHLQKKENIETIPFSHKYFRIAILDKICVNLPEFEQMLFVRKNGQFFKLNYISI